MTGGIRMGPQSCPKDPLRIPHLPQGPSWDPKPSLWDPGSAQRDPQKVPILPQRTFRDLGPVANTLTRPWSWLWDLLRTPILP